METPTVPINFIPAKAGEILTLGTIKLRIIEDGSLTGEQATPYPRPNDTILRLSGCLYIHR